MDMLKGCLTVCLQTTKFWFLLSLLFINSSGCNPRIALPLPPRAKWAIYTISPAVHHNSPNPWENKTSIVFCITIFLCFSRDQGSYIALQEKWFIPLTILLSNFHSFCLFSSSVSLSSFSLAVPYLQVFRKNSCITAWVPFFI